MGVRRALDMVLREANRAVKPLYTFGPLIHNPQVLELLEKRGIKAVNSLEEVEGGTVFIRAHGVPPEVKQELARRCTRVVDATCPHVLRAQIILDRYARKGYTGVIVGDPGHAEVVGLLGFTHGKGRVIQSEDELKTLPPSEKVVLVAQTTQHADLFDHLVQSASAHFKELKVERTICGATHARQAEVVSLAAHVDGMVVVGGYNSANTRRLARISNEAGVPTHQVETDQELDSNRFSGQRVLGVTAGASTPSWMIQRVVQSLEHMRGSREPLWRVWPIRLAKLLIHSNLYIALGGACLTYAAITAMELKEWPGKPMAVLVSFLFLYSIHTLNHFLDREAGEYNAPERIGLYRRHRTWYVTSGIVSQAAVLGITTSMGLRVFLATVLVMVMGLLYSIPLVPESLRHRIPYTKIKDFPGSKSISVALGWGAVTTLLPALGGEFPPAVTWLCTLALVFVLVFVRSAMFELLDVQGDLIVGKETLPILLGESRSLHLLTFMTLGLSIFLAAVYILGWGGGVFLWFEICCLYVMIYLGLYKKQRLRSGAALEGLVESTFVLAGVLAYLHNVVGSP